jgi:hypothetical protein
MSSEALPKPDTGQVLPEPTEVWDLRLPTNAERAADPGFATDLTRTETPNVSTSVSPPETQTPRHTARKTKQQKKSLPETSDDYATLAKTERSLAKFNKIFAVAAGAFAVGSTVTAVEAYEPPAEIPFAASMTAAAVAFGVTFYGTLRSARKLNKAAERHNVEAARLAVPKHDKLTGEYKDTYTPKPLRYGGSLGRAQRKAAKMAKSQPHTRQTE